MKLPAFIHRSITSLIKAVATNKLSSDQLPLAPTGKEVARPATFPNRAIRLVL